MKIGFIGAGRMATALACGIAKTNPQYELHAFDPNSAALAQLNSTLAELGSQLSTATDNQDLLQNVNVVFVAVKPQVVSSALAGLKATKATEATGDQLFVSVAAGVKIETLVRMLGSEKVVRVMPNTPCLIGQGITAFCHCEAVVQQELDMVKSLLDSVGESVAVKESQMDAVTGLSGSGPAYVYLFVESLIEAGLTSGLPRSVARQLAVKTVIGAATMIDVTGEHPAALREHVSSPGGTTIQGIEKLEELGFQQSVMAGVRAATAHSKKMSEDA